jgi:hypothetical protein
VQLAQLPGVDLGAAVPDAADGRQWLGPYVCSAQPVPCARDLDRLAEALGASAGDGRVFGLAPDGVGSVSVLLQDGTHISLPVVGNVFGAHLDEAVQGVDFATP